MKKLLQHCWQAISLFTLILIGFAACKSADKPSEATANDSTHAIAGVLKCPVDSSLPYVPHMWVKSSIAAQNEALYGYLANILATQLSSGTETDSFYFPIAEFRGMIDYFKNINNLQFAYISLITYGSGAPSYVPANLNGKLGFLFTPFTGPTTKSYYLLPENAASFDPVNYQLPAATAGAWITNYGRAIKILDPLLDSLDPGNYPNGLIGGDPATISNTMQVSYYVSDLVELEKEIDYQATLHNTVNGVKAFFSAFPLQAEGTKNAYGNRLYVQFEFTTDITPASHTVFYIDKTSNFCKRIRQKPHYVLNTLGFDNGSLCPPSCN